MDFQFLGGASEVGRLGMVLKRAGTSLLFAKNEIYGLRRLKYQRIKIKGDK
jgi:hypothetical protein